MNRNRDCRRPTRRRRRIRPMRLKAAAYAAPRPRSLRRLQGPARNFRFRRRGSRRSLRRSPPGRSLSFGSTRRRSSRFASRNSRKRR